MMIDLMTDKYFYTSIKREVPDLLKNISKYFGYKTPPNPTINFSIHGESNVYGSTMAQTTNIKGKKYLTEVPVVIIYVDFIYKFYNEKGFSDLGMETIFKKCIYHTLIHELTHYIQFFNKSIRIDNIDKDVEELFIESMCTEKVASFIKEKYNKDDLLLLLLEMEIIDLKKMGNEISKSRKDELEASVIKEMKEIIDAI